MSQTFRAGRPKKEYNDAYGKNKGQTEVYHCATAKYITKRYLDLHSQYPFCEKQPDAKKKNKIIEYKIEALMAKKALSNEDWLLPIDSKKWRLLDAERNFAKADLAEKGKGQRLDILAYETDTKSFVVLELKAPGDKQPEKIACAETELKTYTGAIRKHRVAANKFYSMAEDRLEIEATQVKGYIVCSSGEAVDNKQTPWGIITYDGALVKNEIGKLKFSVVKEPD